MNFSRVKVSNRFTFCLHTWYTWSVDVSFIYRIVIIDVVVLSKPKWKQMCIDKYIFILVLLNEWNTETRYNKLITEMCY